MGGRTLPSCPRREARRIPLHTGKPRAGGGMSPACACESLPGRIFKAAFTGNVRAARIKTVRRGIVAAGQ